ncbi:MAG: NADH-quinone oxidoreductase subunit NuoH [Planctomycetota bacterium]|nr:MAG: NADH-quinone oxidoreductase subunit NuoH [Planctomycetota bacterium]
MAKEELAKNSLEALKNADQHPVGDVIRKYFSENFENEFIAHVFSSSSNILLSILVMTAFAGGTASFLIWLERKVCARMQVRLGPTRVGPFGLLQSIADGIKLVFKEMLRPKGADPFIFYLAPFLPATASFLVLAVIPFDKNIQVVDIDVGALYVIAVSGFGIFGILLGGWASNSKYSLLGAMRAGAQMISYEISVGLGLLLIVMLSGETSLREIVFSQYGTVNNWWIFKLPIFGIIAFILFLISSTAELNRGPFDLPEAESELSAGFHTEYSGITFSMFFLAEFINMFIAGAIGTTFFLGGFLPFTIGIEGFDNIMFMIPGWAWFFAKTYFIIFLFMWFRWSFPRPRIDQLMNLEWKFMLPANLLNIIIAGAFLTLGWLL